jgi:hypothetical protein
VIQHVPHMEVPLTAVQPWQRVPFVVKFGKLKLVDRREEVAAWVIIVVITAAAASIGTAARVLPLALEAHESDVEHSLQLSLVRHGLFESRECVGHQLHGRMISLIACRRRMTTKIMSATSLEPVPTPTVEALLMVGTEPKLLDTKLSRTGDGGEFARMVLLN